MDYLYESILRLFIWTVGFRDIHLTKCESVEDAVLRQIGSSVLSVDEVS
jgi:hypothetical protein